jgi:hypothetical protein
MAEELLERIIRELRERKEAARAAYEESVRLQAALDALGGTGAGGGGAATVTAVAPAPAPGAAPARRTARGENRRRILAVVEERAGASAGEVAQVTGIARPTVASTLGKLAGDGEVVRVERPAGGVGFRRAREEEQAAPEPEVEAVTEPEAAAEPEAQSQPEPDAAVEPDVS